MIVVVLSEDEYEINLSISPKLSCGLDRKYLRMDK